MHHIGRSITRHLGKSFTRNLGRRLYSTTETGSIDKTIIKEVKGKDGVSIFEKIKLNKSWNKLSRGKKIALVSYGMLATTNYAVSSYNDGKAELFEYRRIKRIPNYEIKPSDVTYNNEWEAVKKGCSRRVFEHFWESIVFPFTIISNMMPSTVLWLNPNNKQN